MNKPAWPECMVKIGPDRYRCTLEGWEITARLLPIYCHCPNGKPGPTPPPAPARGPGTTLNRPKEIARGGLGDRISAALSLVGITEDRVSDWLGRPCGCAERREKLNQLGQWVTRVLSGKTENAEKNLDEMTRP